MTFPATLYQSLEEISDVPVTIVIKIKAFKNDKMLIVNP